MRRKLSMVKKQLINKSEDLNGDCSKLRGNCIGLRGNYARLVGYCSEMSGDCSCWIARRLYDIHGNLDDCEITKQDRSRVVLSMLLVKETSCHEN